MSLEVRVADLLPVESQDDRVDLLAGAHGTGHGDDESEERGVHGGPGGL